MGDAGIVVPRKSDAEAQLALSSLVWALEELESYAVARIVARDGRPPLVVLLAPCIEPGLDCLYDVPLPFAEDVRQYRFPPLDRIVMVSGASVTENHRLLPSDALNEAVSDFVDAMDLTEAARDEEG
jgi:ATP-dependent DNA helicase 2 subunit 2